jgi:Tfp pilus assembly pilus retraction ATPase PilT
METVLDLVNLTKRKNGNEILLVPYAEPRVRTSGGWLPLVEQKWDSMNVKETIYSILTEKQKDNLQSEGVIIGSVSIPQGINLSFHFYKHKLGFSGSIREITNESVVNKIQSISQNVIDQILKRRGLHIVAGPTRSGKSTLLSYFIEVLNKNSASHIATIETSIGKIHQSEKSVISQFEIGFEKVKETIWKSMEQVDVMIIDVPFDQDVFENALNLTESGKMVILSVSVDGLLSFENKLNQIFAPQVREFVFNRWAAQMSMFLNLRLVPSFNNTLSLVQETIILNDKLRAHLKGSHSLEIMDFVRSFGEKFGMKTLNQALHQLLVKKKIDLKNAFLFSPNPEELEKVIAESIERGE